jgi:DNA-binding NtrC family response regulator
MARILVVEDDDLLGSAIQLVLEEHDVELVDSPPASNEVASRRPDLILLDFNAVPGGAASWVAEIHSQGAKVPVVLMSGNHDALRSDPVLQQNCAAFLGKPFDLDTLSSTVDRILSAG